MKRCAIYCRVSTNDQTTELQVRELTDFIVARGWNLVGVFEDVASGTATKKRPQLAEMMKLALQRKVDVVAVWKMDRYARSLKDLISMLSQLTEVGVEFVSLRDSIDLSTSQGRLMMQLLGAFGEFETSLIRERVRAGLRNARSKGVKLGPPTQIKASEVLELRATGLSIGQIAKTLNRSKAGIHRVIAAKGEN